MLTSAPESINILANIPFITDISKFIYGIKYLLVGLSSNENPELHCPIVGSVAVCFLTECKFACCNLVHF